MTNREGEGLFKPSIGGLSAYLPKRPQNAAPVNPLPEEKDDDDADALSAEEKAFAEKMGLTAEQFLKSKKECAAK